MSVQVELPSSLAELAGTPRRISLAAATPVTQRSILDALEARHPALRGTLRDQATKRRRPFIRFFGLHADLSHESPDAPLPPPIAAGQEIFYIVTAIAGG